MNKYHRSASLLTVLILTLVGFAAPRAGLAQGVPPQDAIRPEAEYATYVPILMSGYPWRSIVGGEVQSGVFPGTRLLTRTIDLGAHWVRLNQRISWRTLQPNESGAIDWSRLITFEKELIGLHVAGITPMVIVDDHPTWASIDENDSCTAIRAEKRQAFAEFVAQIVERYSKAPYYVRYWELGNEPDVDPIFVPNNSVFGCWGSIPDPYYGGQSYGEMLKVVTPRIRAVDSDAIVLIGGLLLDREVTTDPNNGRPELFLQGILETGAGPYFDGVPYHFYPPYQGDPTIDHSLIGFAADGGVLGKARYIRTMLSAYGLSKPLYLNETALMCVNDTPNPPAYCVPPSDGFYTASAHYAIKGGLRAMSIDVKAFIWYVVDNGGWRNSGLYHWNGTPRPTYGALRTFAQMIRNTTYLSQGSGYPDTHEAFVLRRSDQEQLHVIWSKTVDEAAINAPTAKLIAAYDIDGNALSPAYQAGGSTYWNIGIDPVYIVRRP
jgi:hypothetical protein